VCGRARRGARVRRQVGCRSFTIGSVISHRIKIGSAAAGGMYALVAWSTLAFAQGGAPKAECRPTETQAECHTRLRCKPDEELEQCQKRVGAERARQGEGGGGRRDDSAERGRGRDDDDGGRRGRSDGDRRGDRGERGGRDDRGDRGGRGRRGGGDRHRGGGGGGGGGGSFQANKTFGLGLELGEPTGLNGKFFASDSIALDFGIGWIYRHYYYGDGLHLYGDVLFHPRSLVSADAFELPFYVGVGLRYWDFDYCFDRVCGYRGTATGIRVPLGIAFDFNRVPLDIFVQLVPVFDFLRGDYYNRYRNRTHFGVDFSVGIRFWFK
jgi:hypothetical protein